MHIYTRTKTHTHAHTSAHTRTHTQTHAHTNTHTYTHTLMAQEAKDAADESLREELLQLAESCCSASGEGAEASELMEKRIHEIAQVCMCASKCICVCLSVRARAT